MVYFLGDDDFQNDVSSSIIQVLMVFKKVLIVSSSYWCNWTNFSAVRYIITISQFENGLSPVVVTRKIDFEVACNFFRKMFVFWDRNHSFLFKWTSGIPFYLVFIKLHELNSICITFLWVGSNFGFKMSLKNCWCFKTFCFKKKSLTFYL